MATLVMGTTEECLVHFARSFDLDRARPLMAEFCKVARDTAGRWLNGRNLPVGDELIRLRVFLQVVGYTVSELADVSLSIRRLAQVVALDVVSVADAQDRLGYSKQQAVYRLIRDGGLQGTRVHRLQRLLEETEDELNKQLAMWQARLEEQGLGEPKRAQPAAAASETVSQPATSLAQRSFTTGEKAIVFDHLVSALSAVLENGDQPGRSTPASLPEADSQALAKAVDDIRRRRLIAQLEMLG